MTPRERLATERAKLELAEHQRRTMLFPPTLMTGYPTWEQVMAARGRVAHLRSTVRRLEREASNAA